jgi:HK97 family phage prohead protease
MLSVPIEVEMSANTDKRTIEFYASVFGNRDSDGMRVVKGAFSKSIAERLPQGFVKLYRNHAFNIGRIDHAEEDSHGLFCRGYVSKERLGDETLAKVADRSLTHCSFRAGIVRDRAHFVTEEDPTTGDKIETLNLTELIWREAGPVDLEPANPLAVIVAMKSLGGDASLDAFYELPYLVHAISANPEKKISAEERRILKTVLHLRDVLKDRGGMIEALLVAPGDITHSSGNAPSLATPPADAETQPDLSMLLASLQQRGRVHL